MVSKVFNIRKVKALISLALISVAVFFLTMKEQPVFSADDTVYVRDYGAVSNDGNDDSEAIQLAITAAISGKKRIVQFEAGVYNFKENPISGTGTSAYLYVLGAKNLELAGSVDNKGNPTTKWIRFNPGNPGADLRQLLFVSNCTNIKVKNIVVDNDPYYYSAGKVVANDGQRVTVEVLEGHPRWDGMKAFLPGAYDFKNKRFIKQRIIWTDDSGSNAPVMHTTTGGENRRMYVDSKLIANAVKVGEGLFWFQGNYSPSAQMIINYDSVGVEYNNVKILNSTGFAITSIFVENLTYRNVSLAPEGNRIATAPRDGFHLNNVSGEVLMDGVIIDGICDDGQNCNGFWTTINKKIDNRTLLVNPYKYGNKLPKVGSKVKITKGDNMQYMWEGTVVRSSIDSNSYMTVAFDRDVPEGITYSTDSSTEGKSMFEALSLYPELYIVRNSTIRNSYRGLKVSAFNAQIYNNVFEYNEYDILLGGENDPYFFEGAHPRNVIIRKNVFRRSNSGVGIDLDFLSYPSFVPSPVMSDIHIFDNDFYDQKIGIRVSETKDSYIYENRFHNCETDIKVDSFSAKNISFKKPEKAPVLVGDSSAATSRSTSQNTPSSSADSTSERSSSGDPGVLPVSGRNESSGVTNSSTSSSEVGKDVQKPLFPKKKVPIYLLIAICVVLCVYIASLIVFRQKIRSWVDRKKDQTGQ